MRKSLNIALVVLISLSIICLVSCKKKADQPPAPAVDKKAVESKTENMVPPPPPPPPSIPAPEAKPKAAEPEQKPAQAEVKPAASAEGLVPLAIVLPKPMFAGTPQNLNVPNLEKPLGKPRPAFLAPAGAENVALKKPVTSSDAAPIIGDIPMITDGDKEAADGSFVELGPMQQNVTIDLGAKYEIYAVLLWHYHKQARIYFDVVVQVADDADFVTNVKTVFNNDNDNTSGMGVGTDMNYIETAEGKLIDAKGAQGRYVRLYSNGNNNNELNHYIEVEVWGKPVK
jgi:hypothetical protein